MSDLEIEILIITFQSVRRIRKCMYMSSLFGKGKVGGGGVTCNFGWSMLSNPYNPEPFHSQVPIHNLKLNISVLASFRSADHTYSP